jgi:hypothetical protein
MKTNGTSQSVYKSLESLESVELATGRLNRQRSSQMVASGGGGGPILQK